MFAYRLAEKFGIVDVDAWLSQVPYSVLLKWQAYYKVTDPPPSKRRNAREGRRTISVDELGE